MKKPSLFLAILMITLTASVALAAEGKSFDLRLSNAIVASGNMCDAQTSVLKAVVAHIAGNCDCGARIEVKGFCNVKFRADDRAKLIHGWFQAELKGDEYEITITPGQDDKYGHVSVTIECIPCEKTVAPAPIAVPTPKPAPPKAAVLPEPTPEPIGEAELAAPEEPQAWPLVQVVGGTVLVRADAFTAPPNAPIYFATDDNGWMVRHTYKNTKGKPGADLKAVSANDLHRDAMAIWQASPPAKAADTEEAPGYYAFPVLTNTSLKRTLAAASAQQPILFNLVWFEYSAKGKLVKEHWLPVEDFPNDPHVIIRTDRSGKVVIASLMLQPGIDF